MKFSSALALPALFLGALAAPVAKRQIADVGGVTDLVTGLLADVIPITAAINATKLTDINADVDVGVKIAEITKLVADVVDEASNILGDVLTVTSDTVDTASDVATGLLGTVSSTVGGLKTRQVVDVGSIVDLNAAVELVFSEISATLESVSTVIEIPTDVLSTLGSTITSLESVLSVVSDVTTIVDNIVPDDILSLLGLAL